MHVDDIYNYYVNYMRDQYSNLRDYIVQMQKVITPEILEQNKHLLEVIPDLPKPSYISDKQYYQQRLMDQKNKQETAFESHQSQDFKITNYFKLQSIVEQDQLANMMLSELNQISGHLYILFNRLLEVIKLASSPIIETLSVKVQNQIKERWGESIFRQPLKTQDVTINLEPLGKPLPTLHRSLSLSHTGLYN